MNKNNSNKQTLFTHLSFLMLLLLLNTCHSQSSDQNQTQNASTEQSKDINTAAQNIEFTAPAPLGPGKIIFDTEFSVGANPVTFMLPTNLTPTDTIHLKVTGKATLFVAFVVGDNFVIKTGLKSFRVNSFDKPEIIPISMSFFEKVPNEITLYSTDEITQIKVTPMHAEIFKMEFNESVKIWSAYSTKTNFLVQIPNTTHQESKNRIQFILQSDIENQSLKGDEVIEMFINLSDHVPTRESFETKASGSIGSGLIKTLASKNSLFCDKSTCAYRVAIYTTDINFYNFFPSILANGSELKFEKTFSILEEIEIGETVEYEFSIPIGDDNLLFTVTPIEGTVMVFINPNFKEEDFYNSMYKMVSMGKEEILITNIESKALKFDGKRFFITYISSDPNTPATFRFQAEKVKKHEPVYIKQNYAEMGVIVNDEIVNYLFDLGVHTSETLKVEFRLESYGGSADLYVKECPKNDTKCEVSKEDLDQENSFGRIFRKSNVNRDGQYLKIDLIQLHLNCIGKVFDVKNFDSLKYPMSPTCIFAVGIVFIDSETNSGTNYKLITYGQGFITDLETYAPNLIKQSPKEKQRFRIHPDNYEVGKQQSTVYFKFSIIAGKFKVYFSQTTTKPSQEDNILSLDYENDHFTSIHTKIETGQLQISSSGIDKNTPNYLYMTIESEERSVFEFELKFYETELANNNIDILVDKKITHSRISSEVNVIADGNQMLAVKQFVYHMNQAVRRGTTPQIKFILNSDKIGLNLCVRVLKNEQRPETHSCDFETLGEHLSIDKNEPKMKDANAVMITVQKRWDPKTTAVKFPIEFSVKVDDTDNFDKIELIKPGLSFSSTLNPGISQEYLIDLQDGVQSFSLYFQTIDPEMTINISYIVENENKYLDTLNIKKPVLKIQNLAGFKFNNCKSAECKLELSFYTTQSEMHRYTVAYTFDGHPLILKEGDMLIVENNSPVFFLFNPDNDIPISFSAHSEFTESVITANRFSDDSKLPKIHNTEQLLSLPFDFRSNNEKDPVITIPMSYLKSEPGEKLWFLVRPTILEPITSNPTGHVVLSLKDTLTIHLHAKVLKLVPFYQTKSDIQTGDFRYFYFNIDSPVDFSIVLSVNSGEAVMFLSKDPGILPTKKRFWKASSHPKGDEIVVTKEMLLESKIPIKQMYVGVFGLSNSQFKILFLPDFKNLINVKFQELTEISLMVDKNYYFSHVNIADKYSTLLYSEGSDIEVSALNYQEDQNNFITMVTDEDNYLEKFVFKKGDLPRKRHFEKNVETNSHTIVRIKALKANCNIMFAIYDERKPIEINAEKSLSFTQNENEKSTFVAKFDSQYNEMEIHFKLEFGSISFRYSNDLDSLSEPQKLSIPIQKTINYKVEKTERLNDIVIFKEMFLEVVAHEFSRFSVLMKPKNKFRQIKPFEQEIIHTSDQSDIYLYFTLTNRNVKEVKSILIEYQTAEGYKDRPDLLFISNSDVVLNPDSPFVPMPLNDIYERKKDDFYHLEIRPEVISGSYVIKILKTDIPHPIKINVGLNDEHSLSPNGVYHGSIPLALGKQHQYSIYLPEKGEFRLVLESCHNLQIDSSEFHGEDSSLIDKRDFNLYTYDAARKVTTITFNHKYKQSATYAMSARTEFETSNSIQTILMNLKRGFVNSPGLLKFNVTNKASDEPITEYTTKSYVLMTEFRPLSKELMMKDYIKLPTTELLQQYLPVHYFVRGKLVIKAKIPTFIPQLLVDYPNLQIIVVKFHTFLFFDDTFGEKFSKCAFDCFNLIKHIESTKSIELTRAQIEDTQRDLKTELIIELFDQNEDFSDETHVDVFGSISVHFYNNEDEHHQISKNIKYASSPYFMLRISKKSGSFVFAHWEFLILAFVVCSILFVVYKWVIKKQDVRNTGSNEKKYTRPNDESELSVVVSRKN